MDFSLFPRDLFAEVERLQRELQQSFNVSPSIRGVARGTFPPVNVAATAESAEIYAFAPGLDPKSINVQIERGVLSISGERPPDLPGVPKEKLDVRIDGEALFIEGEMALEMPRGMEATHLEVSLPRYRRVFTLSKDLDPERMQAELRNGVLKINIQKADRARPR